jgi:hypothetical protein
MLPALNQRAICKTTKVVSSSYNHGSKRVPVPTRSGTRHRERGGWMSRSRKRTAKYGFAASEKQDKRWYNRLFRRAIKGSRSADDPRYALLPDLREYSDPWTMNKDGKHWFDPVRESHRLRK